MSAEPSRSAAPRVTVDDFWRLLEASKLLAAERLAALRAMFEMSAGDADPRRLAKWLIAQGAITRYHAQALLAGQFGPFRFGDYVVLEPVEGATVPGLFRGRALAGNRGVLLQFATGKALKKPDAVAHLRETLERWRRCGGVGLIVGEELIDDGPYKLFVLPEYSGESLAERLRVLRVLPVDRACQIVAQLCAAVGGLHRDGHAHSAIRTAAVLQDRTGRVQLLGYPVSGDPLVASGIAASAAETTPYDAPELRAGGVNAGSDVYSLGCVLYELLTGGTPQAAPAIPADQINPATPSDVAALVARCLAADPLARPANANELARCLAPWTGDATPDESPAANVAADAADGPTIAIQTDVPARTIARGKPPQRGRRRDAALVLAAFALLGAAIAVLWSAGYLGKQVAVAPVAPDVTETPTTTIVATENETPKDGAKGYGEPLWERPFHGAPWTLAHLPRGTQMIVALRPRALLATADGEKLATLPGPSGEWLTRTLPQLTGVELVKIDELTLAFLEESHGALPIVAIMRLSEPLDESAFAELHQALPDNIAVGVAARAFGDRLLVRVESPKSDGATLISVPAADAELLAEIARPGGTKANLRPQLEALLPYTAQDADVSVLAAPSYLYETLPQFADPGAAKVWSLLEDWLGRDARGVLANISLSDGVFVEIRVVGDPRSTTRQLAEAWQAKLEDAPTAIGDYLETRALIEYSRAVLLQFGRMLQVLASYTRLGDEHGQLVVRTVLPEGAAHNLYLASYLAVREPAIGQAVASPPATPGGGEATLAEQLKHPTTLSFPNNSLEAALQLLADDAGFKIRIEGNDLKIDGITKNQAIRNLDEQNRPAEEILRTILKKADPVGRLVYLPQRVAETGEEILVITTRAAAAQRGETLPPEQNQP